MESNDGVIPMDYDTYTATVSFMFDTCSSTATTGPFGMHRQLQFLGVLVLKVRNRVVPYCHIRLKILNPPQLQYFKGLSPSNSIS